MTLTKTLDKSEYVESCWAKARDYCDGVENGTIVVCENVRLAVKRHEMDLLREDLDWRPDMVERVFKFFSYLYVDEDKQFILEPFQCFIILALFGLYFKGTDLRKYLYAFLFIGRKNGKTTFAGALQLYFMIGDGQPFPRSLLISASQKNARDTSFGALQEIIKWSPVLNKRLVARRSNRVEFIDSSRLGWSQTTVMDTDKLEGYNPTSCILDEIHTYKDGNKFNVIKNGLGTKKNPMLFLISTGGYGTESFCTELVRTGRNVLRGIMEDDRFFYLLYELDEGDDMHDPANWIKANPGLGTILSYDMFRDDYNTSKNIISLFNDFLTKRLNLFLDENSQWIDENTLANAFKNFDDAEVKGLPLYLGVDLSNTRDLTSLVCVWIGNDRAYVRSYFYFANNPSNILRRNGKDIQRWIDRGYVIPCSTPVIDFDLILKKIKWINQTYDLRGLFYDPWHFDRLLNDVKDLGIWAVPIAPGVKQMDPAIRAAEDLFYSERIYIEDNKCMAWNFRNVVIFRDMNGNMKPNKNESLDAIDGVVAMLNAFAGYSQETRNSANIFMDKMLK